jgi:hypothetical protein
MCGRGGFDPAGFRTSEQRKTHLSATTVTVVRSGADRTSHKVLVRGAEARMVSAFLRPRQKNLKVRPHRVLIVGGPTEKMSFSGRKIELKVEVYHR